MAADKTEENKKQVSFVYTINKEEIPTPFSGFRSDPTGRILLSKELIGADCKVVELKVIAVKEGRLPSEVAYRRYEINESLQPKNPCQ